jgi:predicted RNA binding protein YcfA (HicA-like mRNA interferase family)
MSQWPSLKARQLLKALLKIGWEQKRTQEGSHRILKRPGYPMFVFSFHDSKEIESNLVARIAKATGLKITDL